jgi:hypothetical protein
MDNQFAHALRGLKALVGKEGVEEIAKEISGIERAEDGKLCRVLLEAFGKATRRNGVTGLGDALEGIQKILEGKDLPAEYSQTVGLRAKSELLVRLQNMEAQKRKRIEGFIQTAFTIIKKAVIAAI